MSRGRALGPGRLWKRDRAWVLDFTDEHGRRRRQSLSTDRRTAERIRTELLYQRDMARAGLGAEVGQQMRLADLVEAYLEDLRPRVTVHHHRNVESRLRHVIRELGAVAVRDLRPMDAIRIRNQAVTDGASHRTANLLTDRLQTMLRWGEDNGLIGKSPLARIKRLPETAEHQKYRRRAMSEKEIGRFLAAAEADDRDAALSWDVGRVGKEGFEARKLKLRIPQTPLWRTLLGTAGRWNEIRLSTWADYDLEKAVVVLLAKNTKARKARAIPLSQDLVHELRGFRRLQGAAIGRVPRKEDRVFLSPVGCPWPKPTTNPMRIFDRILERAGIDKVTVEGKLDLHAIRHTALTHFARNGATLTQLQAIAGHSDPKLTAQVYTHLGVEDLRSAVDVPKQPTPTNESKEAR